ncbi:hypothetical protein GCM10020331_044670 [Ectobacillus funiculus]
MIHFPSDPNEVYKGKAAASSCPLITGNKCPFSKKPNRDVDRLRYNARKGLMFIIISIKNNYVILNSH